MISRLACYFHILFLFFFLFLGERPYRCHVPECGRAFIQLSNLQQHLRNHDAQLERAKNRPFQCAICGKGFATESSLRTHTAKVHVHFHTNSFVCVSHRLLSVSCVLIYIFTCLFVSSVMFPCYLAIPATTVEKKPLPFEFSIGPSKKWKTKQLCQRELNVDIRVHID